jgi:hypothetical protein
MRYPDIRIPSFVKRFTKDRRGATVLVFALSLPIIIGFLGLGSEVSYWYVNQRNMQTAADFGAFTAAVELRGNKAESWAVTEGRNEALDNGADASLDTISVNIPPSSGAISSNDAAEVIIVRTLPRLFSALFVGEPMSITARAVAQFSEGGPACILALSRDADYAIDIIGTADVTLTGCDVQSNSTSPNAARVQGAADMTTGCFSAAGGISASAGLNLTECDEPDEGAALSNDPYADLPMPDFTPGDCVDHANSTPGNSIALTEGHYCQLDFKGEVTMAPGLYIVEAGGFNAGAQTDLTGTGVTIILTGGGTVNMNGGAEVKLSAPTADNSTTDSEPYEGILFYQDRDEGDAINRINGNSNSTFEGVFYFPTQAVHFNGNNSSGPGCMMLVANTVRISGSSEFGNACDADDVFFGEVTSAGYVRLME